MDDLETSNPLLPPDLDATSALEVVPVHDNVHSQVEDNGNPRDGGQANQLSVAKKSGGSVVVAVEEGQRLLLEEQEDGVEQLKVLGQVVELNNHPLLAHTATFRFQQIYLRSREQPEAESSRPRGCRWQKRYPCGQQWAEAAQ